ncbi:MAG: ATP-dependent DNA ligase [Desulfitobacteriaceae bacterium]
MTGIEFPLRVMEPCLVEVLPEGDYLYQVKWDGMRWIAWRSSRGFYFQTKQGRIFPQCFPELLPSIEWLPDESMLDGEVVVLRSGKPHFPSLLRRIHNTLSIVNSLPELTVEYVIFDLIYWKGKDLRERPLAERLELLSANIPKVPHCHPIESFTDGVSLWQGTRELSLEGVVAKVRLSPYRPGKNCLWQKLKHWQFGEFLVGGVKFKNRIPTAVCLGTFFEQAFIYVGSVAQGINKVAWNKIKDYGQSIIPFAGNKPQTKYNEEIIWVKPVLPVTVRFLEWTDEGKLRHGQII